MSCSNPRTHIENAVEEVRQALLHALDAKSDKHLSTLFDAYASLRDVLNELPSVGDPAEFWTDAEYPPYVSQSTGNIDINSYHTDAGVEYTFSLSSDYLKNAKKDSIGGDLDAMDDITFAAGPVDLPGSLGEDVIDFGDYQKSREDS